MLGRFQNFYSFQICTSKRKYTLYTVIHSYYEGGESPTHHPLHLYYTEVLPNALQLSNDTFEDGGRIESGLKGKKLGNNNKRRKLRSKLKPKRLLTLLRAPITGKSKSFLLFKSLKLMNEIVDFSTLCLFEKLPPPTYRQSLRPFNVFCIHSVTFLFFLLN